MTSSHAVTRRPVVMSIAGGIALALAVPAAAFLLRDAGAAPSPGRDEPPLEGMTIGRPGAPTVVVEFLSMTCAHCSGFQERYFPEIRRLAVDTGRVRWAFREFPLDPLAVAASALVRRVDPSRRVAAMERLLLSQSEWMQADDRLAAFLRILSPFGVGRADAETALSDKALLASILASRDAGKALGITATPSFVVNGRVRKGGTDVEGFMAFLAEAGA